MPERGLFTIAVLGGTGQEGSGLAFRWAHAGHRVILGSRDADKAARAAGQLSERVAPRRVEGRSNKEAAAHAEVVVLTVPYAAQRQTVEEVRAELVGKILIDVTVPLVPPKVSRVHLPEGGSAVEAMQKLLGEATRVVSAFQHVSAHYLADLSRDIACDVLVCGDDRQAREVAIGLANDAGLRGLHAGPLANSAATEALTSVLIAINRHYKVPAAGLRITGVKTT
ncbi:MAG: NADPH-dependent F420 reductase [Betaproteobacteria bacterium RIFCSPLOWO2_02_FULL_65_24]|nr:MAG: NADPH-dependent F420 reductase [Betaproteobacteria bacterium RIFCSPLOWO2_02_FULL_65_24]OGA74510.1 MAG: NADPH-dependent F420 reductase [Betaproteobacteria bacterium RIFCSPLOWO2_12_FULL_66_14]